MVMYGVLRTCITTTDENRWRNDVKNTVSSDGVVITYQIISYYHCDVSVRLTHALQPKHRENRKCEVFNGK